MSAWFDSYGIVAGLSFLLIWLGLCICFCFLAKRRARRMRLERRTGGSVFVVSENFGMDSIMVDERLQPIDPIGRQLTNPPEVNRKLRDKDTYSVRSEAEANKSDRKCIICCDKVADCVFQGCNHLAACMACGTRQVQEKRKCPICNQACRAVVKIFDVTEDTQGKQKRHSKSRPPGEARARQGRASVEGARIVTKTRNR